MTSPDAPNVDVVIPVHSLARPIRRAVNSVLIGADVRIRITVICHNVEENEVAGLLAGLVDDRRVRILTLNDGIHSPAGPFNAGLDAATGKFVTLVGSDDSLEPGAIDSWVARAERDRADMVIPCVRAASTGKMLPTPPTRPFRSRNLDALGDRLYYRTAPLGLIRTSAFKNLRLTERLPVGEDVAYTVQIWSSGRRISYDRSGPAYVVGDSGNDRVSRELRPIDREFCFLESMIRAEWYRKLSDELRQALVIKVIRIQFFGAIASRRESGWWGLSERRTLNAVAKLLESEATDALGRLSRRDRAILTAVADGPMFNVERVVQLVDGRKRYGVNVIAADSLHLGLVRDAPLRYILASVICIYVQPLERRLNRVTQCVSQSLQRVLAAGTAVRRARMTMRLSPPKADRDRRSMSRLGPN